jgi:hypothetical protein
MRRTIEESNMNYSVNVLPNEPIITAICEEGFKLGPDMIPTIQAIRAILDAANEKHLIIFDLEHATFGLDDIISVANIANRPDISIADHPNVAGMIAVSTNKVISFGAKGLNTPAFKNFALPLFPTLDEAIAYARSKVTEGL